MQCMMGTLRAREQLLSFSFREAGGIYKDIEPLGTEDSSQAPGEGLRDLPWLSWQGLRKGELSFGSY